MYEQFYGLRELPFELTSNPKFLFLTARHREVLSNLQYGISARKGITVLIGEAGTGKTTLVRAALESQQRNNALCVYVNNPTLKRTEFFELLAKSFGLSAEAAHSKTALLMELDRLLRERVTAGGVTSLIIDEAQSMPHELLEEIRLLANMETDSEKLMPVVLTGQPELADRLNEVSLRQLKQRVALRCDLRPLDLQETAAYIGGRIRNAGGDTSRLFTREAVTMIHRRSRGIPRTISVICDNALVSGFALDRRPVGQDIVLEVCRDFDLLRADAFEAAPRATASDTPPNSPEMLPAAPADAARHAASGSEAAESTAGRLFQAVGRRRRFSFF